jgi:uracil-DNA glycosylase
MSVRRKLAGELINHLNFYKDLGVEMVSKPVKGAAKKSASKAVGRGRPAVPGQARGTVISGELKIRAIAANVSMFDSMPEGKESLEEIRADLGDCSRCKLSKMRTHIVYGSGSPSAELMFVGEAPGADEDQQGLPFVGRAGQLLTKIIEAIQMRREDVYICNIIKCRPPGNRNPEPDEIVSCEPFLFRQIACIKPKVICALGTYGAQTLLRTKEPISRLRGQFIDYRGAKLMATFHPAYLLRNPNEKRKVWEDVQKIRDYLRSLRSA